MSKSIVTVPVADWVNDQIARYRAKHPDKRFFTQSSGVHSNNHNVDTFVEEDVELYNSTGEKIIIRTGWRVTFYREYTRYSRDKVVAAIFGPEEQITIRGGARLSVKSMQPPKPRQR